MEMIEAKQIKIGREREIQREEKTTDGRIMT